MTTVAMRAPRELALLVHVFRSHPAIKEVKVFGSRAKGTNSPHSDVDLALLGDLNAMQAEAVAAALDELPRPYHYDGESVW